MAAIKALAGIFTIMVVLLITANGFCKENYHKLDNLCMTKEFERYSGDSGKNYLWKHYPIDIAFTGIHKESARHNFLTRYLIRLMKSTGLKLSIKGSASDISVILGNYVNYDKFKFDNAGLKEISTSIDHKCRVNVFVNDDNKQIIRSYIFVPWTKRKTIENVLQMDECLIPSLYYSLGMTRITQKDVDIVRDNGGYICGVPVIIAYGEIVRVLYKDILHR